MKKTIAVFDFDGTLYKGDSFQDFSIFILGRLKFLSMIIKTSPYIIGWKLGLMSNGTAKEKLFSNLFKGMDYSYFLKKCEEFASHIRNNIKPETLYQLKQHKEANNIVCIVSASPMEWIYPWAREYGVDEFIGTGIEMKNGLITGKFSTPNCYGMEKVKRFSQIYPNRKEYTLWSFGDSKGDLALFNYSDHFVKIK